MANDAEFYDELCIRRAEAYTNGSTTLHLQTQSESRFFCLCALNKTKCVVLMPLPYVTFAPLAPCPIKDGSLRVSTGLGCVVREGILCSVLRGLCLYEGMLLCVASMPLPL